MPPSDERPDANVCVPELRSLQTEQRTLGSRSSEMSSTCVPRTRRPSSPTTATTSGVGGGRRAARPPSPEAADPHVDYFQCGRVVHQGPSRPRGKGLDALMRGASVRPTTRRSSHRWRTRSTRVAKVDLTMPTPVRKTRCIRLRSRRRTTRCSPVSRVLMRLDLR